MNEELVERAAFAALVVQCGADQAYFLREEDMTPWHKVIGEARAAIDVVVRELKAEAWDEGWVQGWGRPPIAPIKGNPYREVES